MDFSKPQNWKLWKTDFVSYEFLIFWNTLLISLVFYWRASKKFIVLSWKKFIGWPIPNHCSAVEASIFYRGIKSYLYFLQFNLFQSIWIEQKILRYLQLLIAIPNSKISWDFQPNQIVLTKKNHQKETDNVSSLRIRVNIQFFSKIWFSSQRLK